MEEAISGFPETQVETREEWIQREDSDFNEFITFLYVMLTLAVFISVFVTGARGSILDAEKTIADLSQAAWDYYSKEKDGNPIDIAERGVRELLRLETRP